MNLFATILGYIGTMWLVISFQCKRERTLFVCQMLSGLFFVFHYGLAGDYTGMFMDGMCFIRALMMASNNKRLTGRFAELCLCAVIVVLCIISWDGIFSVFPGIALLASTIALFTAKGQTIRFTQLLCTSPAWLIYNFHVGSLPGIICETLDMGSVLIYQIRLFMEKRNKA